nr:DUF2637 domain-containing protein [uncultured Actinoplanes sp.]
MILQHLRRVRWAVRATLLLGVAASVVANVLHALDNPISQAIAAWPPLALLLTVELISRVPVHRRWLAAARLVATAIIAGIAAWVSYWHMAGVAARYGETGASPYLLPLSVDGLIVVASICLVELGGRISTLERPAPAHEPAPEPATRGSAVTTPPTPGPAVTTPVAPDPAGTARPVHGPAVIPAPEPAGLIGRDTSAIPGLVPAPGASSRRTTAQAQRPAQDQRPVAAGRAVPAQRAGNPGVTASTGGSGSEKRRRPAAETVAIAAQIKARRPDITETELAGELGISPSTWRKIRREAA